MPTTRYVPRALPGNRRARTMEPAQGGATPKPWLYEQGLCVRIGHLKIRMI